MSTKSDHPLSQDNLPRDLPHSSGDRNTKPIGKKQRGTFKGGEGPDESGPKPGRRPKPNFE